MLMAWCFSTRASVATVLTMHPCVSQCLGVNHFLCKLRWVPQNPSNDKSTLVQIMASYNKPLPESMLIVDPDLYHHMASLGHNESNPGGRPFQDSELILLIFDLFLLWRMCQLSAFINYQPHCDHAIILVWSSSTGVTATSHCLNQCWLLILFEIFFAINHKKCIWNFHL